jgi:general secretion pathway protein J
MIRRAGTHGGFTLLEMLVALAMMSLLAGALYGSLRIGFSAHRTAERAIAPARTLAIALDLLQRDLECALPPGGILAGPFVGVDEVRGEVDEDSLTWFAAAGEPESEKSDVVQIEIILVEGDGVEPRRLVRRTTRNLLAPTVPEPEQETLCRDVAGLNLRYFDGSYWHDSWDSTVFADRVPLVVEITLSLPTDEEAGEYDATGGRALKRLIVLPCGRPYKGESAIIIRDPEVWR